MKAVQFETFATVRQRDIIDFREENAKMCGHYVQLCNNPLRFEPVTKENSVFFDESNRQVRLKYNSYNYVLYFLRSQHYFLTFTCYNTKYIL